MQVVTGIGSFCAEDPGTLDTSIGAFDANSTAVAADLTAPTGGWSTLSGTFNDGAITSIDTAGNDTGKGHEQTGLGFRCRSQA